MYFHEIICEIVLSWFPKYMKTTLFDTVYYPVKYHVGLSRASLFDFSVC